MANICPEDMNFYCCVGPKHEEKKDPTSGDCWARLHVNKFIIKMFELDDLIMVKLFPVKLRKQFFTCECLSSAHFIIFGINIEKPRSRAEEEFHLRLSIQNSLIKNSCSKLQPWRRSIDENVHTRKAVRNPSRKSKNN